MSASKRTRSRRLIVIVFAIFFVPVMSAWVLNITRPQWLPVGRTNNGVLVVPPRQVTATDLTEEGVALAQDFFSGRWTFVHWTNEGCDEGCEALLVQTRQARLALGKDYDRVQRVLVSESELSQARRRALLERHPGLIIAYPPGAEWATSLRDEQTGMVSPISLIDPQGFFMLRYHAEETASRMLKDLKRLLKVSKIG